MIEMRVVVALAASATVDEQRGEALRCWCSVQGSLGCITGNGGRTKQYEQRQRCPNRHVAVRQRMQSIFHLRLAFLHPRNKSGPGASWGAGPVRLSACRRNHATTGRFIERLLPALFTAFTAAGLLAKDRGDLEGVDIEAHLAESVGLELYLAGQ